MPDNISPGGGAQAPRPMAPTRNPFASGFKPNGRKKGEKGFATKRDLLKHMLEVDLRIIDLPVVMADRLRNEFPGMFENIHRKFTMAQIMELTQFQLLFSRSDLVRQHAINSIKDRTEGRPVQKLQLTPGQTEEGTQLVLPNGLVIDI